MLTSDLRRAVVGLRGNDDPEHDLDIARSALTALRPEPYSTLEGRAKHRALEAERDAIASTPLARLERCLRRRACLAALYTHDEHEWDGSGPLYCNSFGALMDSEISGSEDRFKDLAEEKEYMVPQTHAFRRPWSLHACGTLVVVAFGSAGCGPEANETADGSAATTATTATTTKSSSSSAAVDSGSSTGSAPCSVVHEGDLHVETGSDDLYLQDVRVVTGRLIISGNRATLEALRCLEEVGEGLVIFQTHNLLSLAGLENLRSVGRAEGAEATGVGITLNDSLTTLAGLDSLREVSYLVIYDNASLATLGLTNLERIGDLSIGGCNTDPSGTPFSFGDNPSLTALDGFDSLVSLTTLTITGQSGLTSLARLRELAESGVEFTRTHFKLNENLDIAEIQAFMAAAGSAGDVCQHAEEGDVCMCPPAD